MNELQHLNFRRAVGPHSKILNSVISHIIDILHNTNREQHQKWAPKLLHVVWQKRQNRHASKAWRTAFASWSHIHNYKIAEVHVYP